MGSAKAFTLLCGIISIAFVFSIWSSVSPFTTKPARHQQLRHSIEETNGAIAYSSGSTEASSKNGDGGGGDNNNRGSEVAHAAGNPSLSSIKLNKPAVDAAPVEVFEPEIVDGVLQKRAFSSKLRLVFLVGLEGTGHHYIADVLEQTCKTAMVPCPKVCGLAKALYPGLGNPNSRQSYREAKKTLREEMQALARAATHLPEGKATLASFGTCRFQAGMMSYPNFNGVMKTLQYVDFRLLAEEAERAGIDLRLIYLSRSARGVLISDTKHNNYGGG